MKLGMMGSHVTERKGLLLSCEPSLIAVIFLSSFVVLFFVFFRDDTSLFLFYLIFKTLILYIFLIIMIIIPCSGCSGMFQNVPGCSEMFHVPGFIDGH